MHTQQYIHNAWDCVVEDAGAQNIVCFSCKRPSAGDEGQLACEGGGG